MRLTLVGFVFALWACGSDSAPPPTCTGTSCACDPGAACDLGGSACEEDSCTLDCGDMNECTGSCGDSCSASCDNGSTCALTLGASGSISCSGGSTCDITCTDTCSMSCSTDSTCTLTCGDGEAHTVEGGGECP